MRYSLLMLFFRHEIKLQFSVGGINVVRAGM